MLASVHSMCNVSNFPLIVTSKHFSLPETSTFNIAYLKLFGHLIGQMTTEIELKSSFIQTKVPVDSYKKVHYF